MTKVTNRLQGEVCTDQPQGSPFSSRRPALARNMRTTVRMLMAFSVSSLDCALAAPTAVLGEQSGVVPKTITSERMRIAYLVGLEGVGHHYVRSAIKGASQNRWNQFVSASAWEYGCQASMSGTVSRYIESLHLSKEQMRGFVSAEKELQEGQAMVVHFGKFISYPYLGGSDKVFQYTDLRLLAELAEEEGADLRIVYLKRSAQDLVIADTMHRDFPDHLGHGANLSTEERFVEYLKILFTDLGVMHSLLGEIDPAFVVCHDYAVLGDPSQASRIANFISPTQNMAQLIETSLVNSVQERATAGNSSLPFAGASVLVDRMQRKLDVFESAYCMN